MDNWALCGPFIMIPCVLLALLLCVNLIFDNIEQKFIPTILIILCFGITHAIFMHVLAVNWRLPACRRTKTTISSWPTVFAVILMCLLTPILCARIMVPGYIIIYTFVIVLAYLTVRSFVCMVHGCIFCAVYYATCKQFNPHHILTHFRIKVAK